MQKQKKRKYELEVETANKEVKIAEDTKRTKELEVKIAEDTKRTKELEEEASKEIANIAEQKRRKYAVEAELRELYEKEIQKHRLEIEENFQNRFGATKGSALLAKISQISVAIFSPHYSQEQFEIFYNNNIKQFEQFSLNLDQFKKLFEKKFKVEIKALDKTLDPFKALQRYIKIGRLIHKDETIRKIEKSLEIEDGHQNFVEN